MTYISAFLIIMLFIMIGEWVSSATHALIPSVFATALLFIIGFWTILPKNIATSASFGPNFSTICMNLLLINLGTLMSLKELLQQWRAACIAILGVVGTLILTLTLGTLIFDWHTVLAAVPSLTGGIVSALLMTDGLKTHNLTHLVSLPVAMLVFHSLVGYPLTSWLLKQEGNRLVKQFNKMPKEEQKKAILSDDEKNSGKTKMFDKLPKQYNTPSFILVKIAFIALISNFLANLTNGTINSNIIGLILGVLAHQVGFIETQSLNKAGVFNWLMYGLLAYAFSQLGLTTPQQMATIIVQILVLIVLGLIGMFIASYILAKPFKMSWQMAYSCALTSLFGFPTDYILTSEVSREVANNESEEAYLLANMMPKMLVGGFATVSLASVIIASIFLKLL
ncbi:hypothetical protein [Xylocopilactobacillus apicola]|uniref:Integral membrane protein n=1 Tax=Xylocopilactobacillus apicola TaxID=2932184 RepID=A0AAU9CVJ9_9LACO|nr:hypothetical protein [Xylocopilactobacillus apicola]BDR58012.1 hypothetical protein XA3_04530 [Xylocopilactobacillus apicola]